MKLGRRPQPLATAIFLVLSITIVSRSLAVTMEEQISAALGNQNSKTIEYKLSLIPEGTPGRDKVVAHLSRVKKREAADAKKQAAARTANTAAARRAYAEKLREKFLDDGMDIKVSVSGKFATQLNLKYALFNDVWVHKFRKGRLSSEISAMGFKTVDFNNGWDYHV